MTSRSLRRTGTLSLTVLSTAALLLLTACSKEPSEKEFLEAAGKQQTSYDGQICLQLPYSHESSVTSIQGGLTSGWVAIADAAPTDTVSTYMRGGSLKQLDALSAAGLLTKRPYEVYQAGQLVSGTRFSLSEAGRAVLTGNCLLAGQWSPSKLVKPRSAVEQAETKLIVRKQEGDAVSYSAHVAYELKNSPAWVTTPDLQAAYGEQLSAVKAGKVVNIELVEFNKQWTSKKLLAQDMAKAGAKIEAGAGKVLEIPADLQEAALTRINGSLERPYGIRSGSTIALPLSASETPPKLAQSRPGALFFTPVADAQALVNSQKQEQLLRLEAQEKGAASLPEKARQSVLTNVAAQRELLTKGGSVAGRANEGDRYLNQRRELLAVLDALVTAGAYVKKDVQAGEVPELTQAGTLYTPAPGVRVSSNGALALGTMRAVGPLEQKVNGRWIDLTVGYELTSPAPWLDAFVKAYPDFQVPTKGKLRAMARPTENAEFPYIVDVTGTF